MLLKFFLSARHMTRVPKKVYTVLGLQRPKFQIFIAKFTSPCLDPFFQKVLISPKVLAVWLHLNRPLFRQPLVLFSGGLQA